MKTTKPELKVPDEALTRLHQAVEHVYEDVWADDRAYVRAIATPVVVAVLREQAALIRRSAKYGPSDAWMPHKLERRADELEAGA